MDLFNVLIYHFRVKVNLMIFVDDFVIHAVGIYKKQTKLKHSRVLVDTEMAENNTKPGKNSLAHHEKQF